MGLTAKDTGGGDFKVIPEDTWIARCYQIIDLGTHKTHYQGQPKIRSEIRFYWEILGEDPETGGPLLAENGKPLTASQLYTNSLGEKATLRRDLESWRGKKFTADELAGFKLTSVLGAYCLLQIVHNVKDGRTYANVQSVSKVPTSMKADLPDGVHPLRSFDVDNPDMAMFGTFNEKLQEKIRACREWENRVDESKPLRSASVSTEQIKTQQYAALASGKTQPLIEDDDIPF